MRKLLKHFFLLFVCFPCVSFAVGDADFEKAAKLLTAARNGDNQTVQVLINSGADVNYTDGTGLSLVCTAVMNNDTNAIKILQAYGADASKCDRQIKKYKQKSKVAKSGEETGFFSGLSSTHIIALSAVGVAGVVGGIALLANVFDKDNKNSSSASTGSHSGSGGGTSTTVSTEKLFEQNLPYGPACSESSCPTDFSFWEQTKKIDFDFMSTDSSFNYLMVAHAYDAFVRGYLGMETIRISSDLAPFDLSSLPYAASSLPGGGKPVNVAMITASGVNATPGTSAVDGIISWVVAKDISKVQSICNESGSESSACQTALVNATKTSHKYFNYTGAAASETENTAFDLTGAGSVFGNATDADTKLAKIIAGWEEGGRDTGDFYGFIPNGQLTVYKSGNGTVWTDATSENGTDYYEGTSLAVNGELHLFGNILGISSLNGDNFVATYDGKNYVGYISGNNLYIDSDADGVVNQMYTITKDEESDILSLSLAKELKSIDYKNYTGVLDALRLKNSGEYVSNVVANLFLPPQSSSLGYETVADANVLNNNATTDALKKTVYKNLIDTYYNLNTSDDSTVNTPGTDADLAFKELGNYEQQILVNSAGRTLFGDGVGKSLSPQPATFENFAPVVYPDLQNLFATVVAVKPADSTKDTSIDSYNPTSLGKLELSTWTDSDSNTYQSRVCGLTGTGNGGAMNPWCFAAPGTTDMDATATMAGSIALVKSAFNYMTPEQIFLLLALTADGPFLGTNPETNSVWTSKDDLRTYLQNIYSLPASVDGSDSQYLESFKSVFGYGMINLERATRPSTNVYFYSSDKDTIVQSSGNAYWGKAVSTISSSRSSSALNTRGAVRTSFYDVITSADGTLSLPRVWSGEISLNNATKQSLYMGDVLGDFYVGSTNKHSKTIDNFTFDMSISPRAYNDNLNGLNDLRIAFTNDIYDINVEYQNHLTDGESRFYGRANSILSLVSNAVISGAKYKYGKFSFGAHAFYGVMSDENLLDKDPAISHQFEPARLGLANGGAVDLSYHGNKFNFDVSFGNMRESQTVLGAISDGLLSLNGANTQYVDVVTNYRPIENMNLFTRATFANTSVDNIGGLISSVSDIKSNAFAIGSDFYGFNFTVAMPLAVIDGKMGYDYADFVVVENEGKYEVAMNNPHVEYIDLVSQKRELRFSLSYKQQIGEFTDAGVGFIYRDNPNNTNMFGNESILMFKIHHRLGI